MSIEQYLRAAPKAELHAHLEGSIRPATMLELAKKNHVQLPFQTVEEAQRWFQFRDFPHFVEIFVAGSNCVQTSEDYEQITYEFGETMARQHVRYAEVTFSVCAHTFTKGIAFDTYFSGLTRGRQRAYQDFGVEINWVFDVVRDEAMGPGLSKHADYTLKVAIEGMQDGVISLGLGGNEVGFPAEWFTPWFDQARAAGLHSVPHAGETVGPESVWGAIRTLKAERIGHGVRSIEDPALIAYLAEQQIPLEVSPTSNICLGIYPDYDHHPLHQLLAAGIPLTINTDDPSLFNTTMNDEFILLHSAFQLDIETINQLLLNGIRQSFLPTDRKQQLVADFQIQLSDLAKTLL